MAACRSAPILQGKEPFQTPPIHIKWPALDSYKYPYKPAPDPYYPKYYRWYEEPAYTSPRYVGPRPRPHADRPKVFVFPVLWPHAITEPRVQHASARRHL